MANILNKILRAGEGKYQNYLRESVSEINKFEDKYIKFTDQELKEETDNFKRRYQEGESLDQLLPEAFAVVREAAKRVLGQRHYDVQLMGGIILHEGKIAEMKTGEGKTLVSTLPSYLNALSGQRVHIVTVNDYLAERDSNWMGQIHRFLGLTVGLLKPDIESLDRREVYKCDIIYGTNSEFGFDYLRDNMVYDSSDVVSSSRNYAIIDEIDSILIDEARTPLIVSGLPEKSADLYKKFSLIVNKLSPGDDYLVDLKKNTVSLNESGERKIEGDLKIDNLYSNEHSHYLQYVATALKAKELFHKDIEYIISDGEIKIVDEHTGRVMEGRRFSEGIHQAIEAKEGVRIKEETQTLASITIQNYFRMYKKISGMTGTAMTEESEFFNIYGLNVVVVPTNRENIRIDENDLIFGSKEDKLKAIIEDVKKIHSTGQPILIGTTSIENSEIISKHLTKNGVKHEVLNAKNHAREAHIIARAGNLYSVTVATNMAGRGTDIILGGNPEVIASEKFLNKDMNDEEVSREFNEEVHRLNELNKVDREKIVSLGGLYVLGTERHESRRIDNQLRGRSGRQGDPGRSKFYLSLEDDIMKRFPTMALSKFMNNKSFQGMAIDNKIVSNSIQRAQSQLEGQNYEMRKEILKYDDVINEQRKIYYTARDKFILEGEFNAESYIRAYVDELSFEIGSDDFEENWDLIRLEKTLKALDFTDIEYEELLAKISNREIFYSEISNILINKYYKKLPEDNTGSYNKFIKAKAAEIMDKHWIYHLHEMDYLREGINLRANAQRDPLVEYKGEAYNSFQEMEIKIKIEIGNMLVGIKIIIEDKSDDSLRRELRPIGKSMSYSGSSRNQLCPCGSGKKYKRCHGV